MPKRDDTGSAYSAIFQAGKSERPQPPATPPTSNACARLPKSVHKKLRRLADELDVSNQLYLSTALTLLAEDPDLQARVADRLDARP